MSDSTLAYAVHTATWQGVTRDLPHGPEDLQWVANSATLIYGDQDAVLVDTYTSIEQNAELVQWVRSFGKRLTYIYITHGHGDHFFGIGQLQEAFPEATAVASHGTIAVAHLQAGRGTVRSSGRSCSRDRSPKSHAPSLSAPSSSSWRDTGWRSSRPASPTPPTPPACGCPTSA
jgi:glyoxylase-like metal-dependent hydrolase (beta-lactamase superfamily II)